jgi:hypothetical protein
VGGEDSGLGNERGYTSDSELMYGEGRSPRHVPSRPLSPDTAASSSSSPGGWILVGAKSSSLSIVCIKMTRKIVSKSYILKLIKNNNFVST